MVNPRRGGGGPGWGGRGKGPGGCLWGIWEFGGGGGGPKFFFSGPKCPPSLVLVPEIRLNFFETRYESSLVCPAKVLS